MKDDICGDVGRVLLSLVDIVVRLEYTVIMIIIVHFQRITHMVTWPQTKNPCPTETRD